jgi:hypothetical protein
MTKAIFQKPYNIAQNYQIHIDFSNQNVISDHKTINLLKALTYFKNSRNSRDSRDSRNMLNYDNVLKTVMMLKSIFHALMCYFINHQIQEIQKES